jgi:glycosyltransferase involved in cell wall biosynthesis
MYGNRAKMNSDQESDEIEIVYISNSTVSGWKGDVAGLKNMLNILRGLMIKTNVIGYSFYSDKFCIEHKEIDSSSKITTVHLPSNLPNFLKAFSIFLILIYGWKPSKNGELIFAEFYTILTALPGVILGKIFGKPVILNYVDTELKHVPDFVYKYVVKNSDIVFAISPYLIDKAKRYGCKNVVYLPPFVDMNLFSTDMDVRGKMREDLGIINNDIVVGHAGSFSHIEGLPILLQAFKNLSKKHSNIKLIILGGKVGGRLTKDEDDVTKLVKNLNIEDKVIIVPPQPHEEVPKFLSACDITCCPKIDCAINRAANPIKVVEYLSMGLPTVCSAIGGIVDTIEDGVDGILVKPGDVNDLEEKLEWIIQNLERAKEIGENGRKKAIEKYSYEAIEDTIKRAISGIVDRKKGNKVGD